VRWPAGRRAGGGGGWARLIAATLAQAGALVLAVYAALGAPEAPVLIFAGGVGFLLFGGGLLLRNPLLLTGGVAVLAGQFVLVLYVRGNAASYAAAAYGAALLLVSELAYWSLDMSAGQRGGDVLRRRAIVVAILVAAAFVVGTAAAAISRAAIPGSLLLTALGVGCVLAALGIVAILLWPGEESVEDRLE
jgi:hypothetical protein